MKIGLYLHYEKEINNCYIYTHNDKSLCKSTAAHCQKFHYQRIQWWHSELVYRPIGG